MLPPEPVASVDRLTVKLEPALSYDFCGIGIDPGQVNMGIAFVYKNEADLFQIKLPSNLDPVVRMQATANAVNYLLSFRPRPIDDWKLFSATKCHCVIEGAAYGAVSGQVPLAENRTTCAMMAMTAFLPVAILPPAEIKQRIFGKGNLRARDVWPHLQIKDDRDKVLRDDAAAALSCALYAYTLLRKAALTEKG